MVGALVFDEVMASLNWPFAAAMSFVLLFVGLLISNVVNGLVVRRFMGGTSGR
jgi:ABC-type spermidine/putrescine transport system permease subunit I